MPEMTVKTSRAEWVRGPGAVEHIRNNGFDAFTYNTLKHYAYDTDLLPKPKVVGGHAYWRISDLDKLIEAL
jgi:hypothetical protein